MQHLIKLRWVFIVKIIIFGLVRILFEKKSKNIQIHREGEGKTAKQNTTRKRTGKNNNKSCLAYKTLLHFLKVL